MITQTLSTVTPVYQGADYLASLVDRLDAVRIELDQSDIPLELVEAIFVDDGSRDDSATVLEELSASHPWVTVITLSRNFGQHPATVAGLLHSAGDWTVTLDEDLQHDPKHIVALLKHGVEQRADLVYATPTGQSHSTWRVAASRTFKRVLVKLSGSPQLGSMQSFRLIRGSIARGASAAVDHDMYFDVALGWFTDRVATLNVDMVDHRSDSGYSLRSLLSHARRAMLSSEVKVLRLAALFGAFAIAVASALVLWAIGLWATGNVSDIARGWASLFVAVLVFGGVQTSLLIALLEYSTSSILHLKGKPALYTVDRSGDAFLRDYFATEST